MKLSRLITIFLFLVGLVVLYRVSCYVPPIREGEIAAWDRDGVLEGVEIQNGKWKRVYSSEYKRYKVGNQQKGRIVRSNDLHLSGTIVNHSDEPVDYIKMMIYMEGKSHFYPYEREHKMSLKGFVPKDTGEGEEDSRREPQLKPGESRPFDFSVKPYAPGKRAYGPVKIDRVSIAMFRDTDPYIPPKKGETPPNSMMESHPGLMEP